MRCNLRSYLRVLDPLLHILLDQRTRGSNHVREYGETRVEGFVYERPFDHERVNYTLATVLAVARFGGQGFAKTARGTMVRKSFDRHLAKSVEMGESSLW